jgi:hypothetical protein
MSANIIALPATPIGIAPTVYRVRCETCIYDGEPLTFPSGLSFPAADLLATFHNARCHPEPESQPERIPCDGCGLPVAGSPLCNACYEKSE